MYIAGIIVAAAVLFITLSENHGEEITGLFLDRPVMKVIGSASAGYFYPGSEAELRSVISGYLSAAEEQDMLKPRALIVPHSSYEYSGLTAAHGYRTLEGHEYERVMILAPSTQYIFSGAAVPEAEVYETPLGRVNISGSMHGMDDGALVFSTDRVFDIEHTVDVQVPFLQQVLRDFDIMPVLTSRVDPKELAERILPYIDDETLLVVSSDLSYDHGYGEALLIDMNCTEGIPELDFLMMDSCEASGKIPILTLMLLAREMGWSGRLLDYSNSGDTFGMKESVVGYASFVFYQK
jgi:AmmeMemoRadiSam system protein B